MASVRMNSINNNGVASVLQHRSRSSRKMEKIVFSFLAAYVAFSMISEVIDNGPLLMEGSMPISAQEEVSFNRILMNMKDDLDKDDAASENGDKNEVKLSSMIKDNVADANSPVQSATKETPLFWHVPKAGGTAIQHLYWCMGLTLANEVGANPKFGKHETTVLEAFRPWKHLSHKVVNVDTTTYKGLMRAKAMNLLGANEMDADNYLHQMFDVKPEADLVLSGEFQLSAQLLYSPTHKARVFGLFRHRKWLQCIQEIE